DGVVRSRRRDDAELLRLRHLPAARALHNQLLHAGLYVVLSVLPLIDANVKENANPPVMRVGLFFWEKVPILRGGWQDWNPTPRPARHGIPRYFCVCKLSRQRGWARQYSTARRVLRSRSGPSIGCKKKWRKPRCS